MRSNGLAWRISCCGIFCASQEGSEVDGKISYHLSSQNRVSRGSHVQILWSIQKRLLCFCPSPWQSGEGCSPCGTDCSATWTLLLYIRIPKDVEVAEKSKDLPRPQDCTADHAEVRFAVWNPPPQEMAADGARTSPTSTPGRAYCTYPWSETSMTTASWTFAEANEMIDRYIYFYNHERIQLKTGETPLRLKFNISCQGLFFVLSTQLGAVQVWDQENLIASDSHIIIPLNSFWYSFSLPNLCGFNKFFGINTFFMTHYNPMSRCWHRENRCRFTSCIKQL